MLVSVKRACTLHTHTFIFLDCSDVSADVRVCCGYLNTDGNKTVRFVFAVFS